MEKKMVLMSSDGKFFELEETLAMEFPIFAAEIVKNSDPRNSLLIESSVNSLTLKKCVDYFQYHATERISGDDLNIFDDQLVKTDSISLFNLIHAAHEFKIKRLMDFACEKFEDLFTVNTFESIRALFINAAGTSVMRKGKRVPQSEKEREIVESKMVDPKGSLKLGSGTLDMISDYSPEVAFYLHSKIERKITRIKECSIYLKSNGDVSDGTFELYNMIARERGLCDLDVLADKVASLIQILEDTASRKIQHLVTLILANIRNWGKESKKKTIPLMLRLIDSDQSFHGVLLVFANFASDPSARKAVLASDILSVVETVAAHSIDYYVLRGCAKLLAAICSGNDDLHFEQVEVVLQIIKRLIQCRGLEEGYMPYVCKSLAYLSVKRFNQIDENICGFLVYTINFFGSRSHSVSISALEVIGNIARWGNDLQIQYMIGKDVLKCLRKLLTHDYEVARKEACLIISNIVARSRTVIDVSCKRVLIDSLVKYLGEVESPDGKMDTMWAIFNCIIHDMKFKEIKWPIRSRMLSVSFFQMTD